MIISFFLDLIKPVAKKGLQMDDHLLFLIGKVTALDTRPEIIRPSESATLTTS